MDALHREDPVLADLERLPNATTATWLLDTDGAEGLDAEQGFMDLRERDLPADAQYYLCGPLPFMQSVRSALIERGVPARDIQYEVFGPDLWLADYA